MTTEILRNMLYRGSEILHEVAWVLFDEIHYMRDRTRGVVWEEAIILLPTTVHMVFLSATIANAQEFAAWIATLHSSVCTVVYTEYRPTPLQHYLYPCTGQGMYCIYDSQCVFREHNYEIVLQELNGISRELRSNKRQRTTGASDGSNGGTNSIQLSTNNDTSINQVIRTIQEKRLDPCIIFSFSKRECEQYASQVELNFCNSQERKLIHRIFTNAINILKQEDRELPQVQNIFPYLQRGIGIHHSGL
uniref:Superkiller viralicidic activity 2-like 2 n=1 Tax=Lygus hesperus TaxID=30085 RepID=A0A0A9ZG17_LYGHE